MKCPVDNTNLHMSERQGVEIDYCPQCRGVWLDRGELDKIIERDSTTSSVRDDSTYTSRRSGVDEDYRQDAKLRYPEDSHHYKKRKRESFLGDLFDF